MYYKVNWNNGMWNDVLDVDNIIYLRGIILNSWSSMVCIEFLRFYCSFGNLCRYCLKFGY